jgi:hypothetical protein
VLYSGVFPFPISAACFWTVGYTALSLLCYHSELFVCSCVPLRGVSFPFPQIVFCLPPVGTVTRKWPGSSDRLPQNVLAIWGGGGITARGMVSLGAYLSSTPFSAAVCVCACVCVWRGSSNRLDTSFPARLLMWSSGSVGAVCGPVGSRELFHKSFLSRLHVACRWPGPVWCGI